jgi:phosphoribosylglycinamide formyltransferase 1
MVGSPNEALPAELSRRGARIALITYDVPHKKTHDVLLRLIWRELFNVTFVVTPFKSRPSREVLFQHRPSQLTGPAPTSLASRFGLGTLRIEDWRSFRGDFEFFLVCGSGLIDPEFCQTARIVNCHPGLIPQSRGLDAFKWAIYNDLPIGNTLHFIDHQVDLGEVFHHQMTDIFPEDDFAAFAERHYTAEIHLLSHFDCYLQNGKIFDFAVGDSRKRMPRETEAQLVHRFEVYKEKKLTGKLDDRQAGELTVSRALEK